MSSYPPLKINNTLCVSGLIDYACFSVLALMIMASSTVEADDGYPSWSLKGFGSIGLARSDNETIGFYRNRTQNQEVNKSFEVATDSRLGLQLDVDINDDWHLTTQFVVRDHAGDFFEQNLDWAFIKWTPIEFDGYEVRVGRLGVDAFLLSDYRNVGYAYPWIRPPHEFYANIPLTHYDGIDVKKTFLFEEGELAIKFGGGYTATKLNDHYLNYDLEGPFLMANMVYTTGNWRSRIGYGYIWQNKEIKSDDLSRLRTVLSDPISDFLIPHVSQLAPLAYVDDSYLQFMSIGTAYDDGTWLVHTEAAFVNEEEQQLVNTDAMSAYLSIGRRFSDVMLYSRYGILHGFHETVDALDINPQLVGTPLEPVIQGMTQEIASGFNKQQLEQQSLSVGMRWDVYQRIAFKAEWTHYWLGDNGQFASLWQYDDIEGTTPNHINLVSFGIDFIF